MSIVDDLVSNLVERNKITLNGAFTISLWSMAACRSRANSFRPFEMEEKQGPPQHQGSHCRGCQGRGHRHPAAPNPVKCIARSSSASTNSNRGGQRHV